MIAKSAKGLDLQLSQLEVFEDGQSQHSTVFDDNMHEKLEAFLAGEKEWPSDFPAAFEFEAVD